MVKRVRFLTAGLAAVVLTGTAAAQTEVRQQTTTTTSTTEVRKASVVMNANVVVEGGASVGRITDFVITDGGCIDYVVVGYGDKFVLLPYQAIRVDAARRVVSVNITQDKFREIPTFTGSNWPIHDDAYLSKVRTVVGVHESGYRGDRREGDRRPMAPGDRRDDRRDNRRDNTQPPTNQPNQRPNVENPNRTGNQPPPNQNPPATRPGDNTRPGTQPPDANRNPNTDPNRNNPPPDRDRDRDRNRTPPQPPPGTPGTGNPPPPA
jgi:hypothetical protein